MTGMLPRGTVYALVELSAGARSHHPRMQDLRKFPKVFDNVLTLPASQKEAMWKNIAEELNIPWRAVEDMHWMLGQEEMANLAGGHLLHGPKRSGSNRDSSGTSILSGPSPSDAPHAMHTGWMSTPSSTFSRLPSYPGTMLAQAPQPATTNGTAPPRAMVGGEETGFGFHRTSRRQSSSSGQFPSVAELERGITAYAAQARNRYRGEDEEEGAREEEMEEDVVRRRR